MSAGAPGAPAIRAATPEDIPALVGLLAALFAIEQDFSPDAARQARGLAGVIASPLGRVTVATAPDGSVIGMCSGQLVFSSAEGAPSVWVEDVVVAEGWRRQGIGRALLSGTLDWATGHGATRAQLLVDLDNPPALAFYQRLGWAGTRLAAQRLSLDPAGAAPVIAAGSAVAGPGET
ncbi:MAG: GNAT family N-acetyltransferase [Rhodocyclaceae bacterium]|nr:GNAT family N-acetyltransferase [Rhodocyclaceae bacterium]